ncbi:MAG: dihydroneopterin aldolase, partial [Myxococcales bacterium]|nr:dihydroneopterin aldolase [Myxococcales bacterium]
MDRVRVEGLVLEGSVGVYDHEQGILQRLEIDITAHIDLVEAGLTDRLEAALDYDLIASTCREVVAEKHHALIESIAERIAERSSIAIRGS